MKLTKENKTQIKNYILESINGENYNTEFKTETEKLKFVLNCFNIEYGVNIKRLGLYRTFSEYLRGLPSCFNIDFYNHKILELAYDWGQDTTNKKQRDKIISQWFDFITNQFFKICKSYKIEV